MFNLHDFVLKTIKNMIGNMPDYKVQEYTLSWYTRGTLTDDDMIEINSLIQAQYPVDEDID